MKNVYPIRGTSSQDEALLDLHVQELERERMERECMAAHKRRSVEKRVEAGMYFIIVAALILFACYILAGAVSR